MAKKTLTSGLLGTVTGLNKETGTVSDKSIKTLDDLSQVDKEPEQPLSVSKRKPGRPNVNSGEPEIYVTFKLPDSLVQEIKMKAVTGRTTQKEIVIAALRNYLSQKAID